MKRNWVVLSDGHKVCPNCGAVITKMGWVSGNCPGCDFMPNETEVANAADAKKYAEAIRRYFENKE